VAVRPGIDEEVGAVAQSMAVLLAEVVLGAIVARDPDGLAVRTVLALARALDVAVLILRARLAEVRRVEVGALLAQRQVEVAGVLLALGAQPAVLLRVVACWDLGRRDGAKRADTAEGVREGQEGGMGGVFDAACLKLLV